MGLPKKLKYFNLFFDATSYIGVATSVTLPKLTQKLEKLRAAGMPVAVDVNMGLDDDALQIEFSTAGLTPEITKTLGGTISGAALRFAGAYQQEDSEDFTKVEIEATGRIKEQDGGESKQGEDTEFKYSMSCTYYKLTIDGSVIIEIDALNMIYKVGDKDRLAAARQAIGL